MCSILGWSAFAAVIVTIVVYLLNWPLANYDIYVRSIVVEANDRI